MAEIKWIKITTDIFDDDKIKIIDKYPARDEILVIWFKILALAGKTNQSGLLFMSNRIPYTTEMLAAVFNREEATVKMALMTFEKFGMIHIEENEIIAISNWEKHQNIDGMEKIREQNRVRKQLQREHQKLIGESRDGHATVTDGHAIEEDKELDKDKRILTPYDDIFKVFAEIGFNFPSLKAKTDKRKAAIKSIWKDNPNIEYFADLFQKANESDFLTGKINHWSADFDWILKNHVKITEGSYVNKGGANNGAFGKSNNRNNEKSCERFAGMDETVQF